MTLFDQCVEAIADLPIDNGEGRNTYAVGEDGRALVRAVLETLRAGTGSPYTADELCRVLGDDPCAGVNLSTPPAMTLPEYLEFRDRHRAAIDATDGVLD